MTEADENPLDEAQRVRTAALGIARAALSDQGDTPITEHQSLPKRFGVQDLTTLAEWIVGSSTPTVTVVVVPDDVVEAVSRLNPADNFRPGGLLVVPESIDVTRMQADS